MEPEEILEGEIILELLRNILKRTPDSVGSDEAEGEEFDSAEHENIGNKVKLRFPAPTSSLSFTEQEVVGADRPLRLPNGLELSFGQIIVLAGDFYGVPERPVIDPTEKAEKVSSGRRRRFITHIPFWRILITSTSRRNWTSY